MCTLVKFLNSKTAKINNAGYHRYLTTRLEGRRNLVLQVKNKTKQEDDYQFFETNQQDLYHTNDSLRIREHNFSPTDISERDLRVSKLDKFFVWDFRGIIENLNEIELFNSHIEKLQRVMNPTTTINGMHNNFSYINKTLRDYTPKERQEYFMSISALKLLSVS